MERITIKKPERTAMEVVDFFDEFLVNHNIFVTPDPNHPAFSLGGYYSQMIQDIYEILQKHAKY